MRRKHRTIPCTWVPAKYTLPNIQDRSNWNFRPFARFTYLSCEAIRIVNVITFLQIH